MSLRFQALVCLGLACLPGLHGAARAAGEPRMTRGVAAVSSESGSSSRETRQRAAASLPLERMGVDERRIAEQAVANTTLCRRLPTATMTCDAALLDFILSKPQTLVDVWRVLGISRLELDPSGPGRWRLSDGYGTVGAVRLLHRERTATGGLFVFHGRGAYDGPLSPKQLSGSCLVVVRYDSAPATTAGRPRQHVTIDAFLDVDGMGLEIVTRTLQPLIVRSAAANLHEISLFVTQFAAAAERHPAAVAGIADRMARTSPEDRATLVALASGRRSSPGMTHASITDDVQMDLAARWMTVDQLDIHERR